MEKKDIVFNWYTTNEVHKNCKIACLQLLIASPVHLAHVFLSSNGLLC